MRENEKRIGGLSMGLFSIFEPAEPRPGRVIDQSVVAWRLASKKTGGSAFENPHSVIQRTVNMVTVGSNACNRVRGDNLQSLGSINEPVRFTVNPSAALPYNREELLRWHYTPDNPIPVIPRRRAMTAGEVRAQMVSEREANRREGFRYPTPEEVSEIQRRFVDPEFQAVMELAQREYLARMMHLISESPPPGFREAMEAVREIHAD